MSKINLLDCTLREAPIKDLILGSDYIQKFINALEKSNIDIIECGFLKDSGDREDNTIFRHTEDIERYLTNKKPDTLYVALVDYGRYDLKNLSPFNGKSIDGIRICFKKSERKDVIPYAKAIKALGYKVFLQHVDTLSYSDLEILELLESVNELKPYAYSLVDTFGSMYAEDLRHLFEIANRNLDKDIRLGFHAHNNLMLAVANSQFFISLASHTREIMVDASVLGCGRGAGNSNTELLAEFINKKYNGHYNLNELLDIIDTLMPKFHQNCHWGYSIPYFLSGVHNAHVFNVNHLLRRHNIQSKDLRAIIENLDDVQKKKYDYAVLEKLYVEHFDRQVDDKKNIEELTNLVKDKKVLFIAPGASLSFKKQEIFNFIRQENTFVVAINNYLPDFPADAIFFSNMNRYQDYRATQGKSSANKIFVTSNVKTEADANEMIFNYLPLIKFGWINIDTSFILALRLFIKAGVKEFTFAGFDGFSADEEKFYYSDKLLTATEKEDLILLTKETHEMLADIIKSDNITAKFLTPSVYEAEFAKETANV